MKAVFVGGGSYTTLPIARGIFGTPEILAGGELALYDPNLARAEAMGRMLRKTPEFAATGCRVTWGDSLEAALEGADVVRAGFPIGSPLTYALSSIASRKHGFLSSDQLSPTGAFLALKGGPILLNIARKMERLCPNAWLLSFANPVAVYSALVNNHTRIRALGICGGYTNHMWDLTRLMGKDALCPEYDVEVAGVNHLSFILRGTLRGEELYALLARHLTAGWEPPYLSNRWGGMRVHIRYGLRRLAEMFGKFGVVIFSTEGDGMAHLWYEEMFERSAGEGAGQESRAAIEAGIRKGRQAREESDRAFRATLDRELDAKFWAAQDGKNSIYARDDHNVTVKILQALAGPEKQQIVTSHPNRGAVAGFTDRTVLEYSQYLDRTGLSPAGTLAVPAPFQGIISALAAHQTLLADAIATEDPKLLFQALYAYPIKQNTRESRALFRDLLEINAEEIAPAFQGARQYLLG